MPETSSGKTVKIFETKDRRLEKKELMGIYLKFMLLVQIYFNETTEEHQTPLIYIFMTLKIFMRVD